MYFSGDDHAVLAAWGVGEVESVATPPFGAVNRTLLLETLTGPFVLRAYSSPERERVAAEHRLIAQAGALGLPVVAPISLPGGRAKILSLSVMDASLLFFRAPPAGR